MGLNNPFFQEFITFKDVQNNEISFEISPKYRGPQKMIYNYEGHPNITFDALVRILTMVYRVVQRDKLRILEEE